MKVFFIKFNVFSKALSKMALLLFFLGLGQVVVYAQDCPTLTNAPPAVRITNSTCTTFGGTPSGGSIAAPILEDFLAAGVCPTGSTLMYAVNDGEYSTTLPTYNQTTALSVSTRCDCDGGEDPVFNLEGGTTSPVTTVTTKPEACPECPTLTNAPPAVRITNSTCTTFGGTPSGGSIAAPILEDFLAAGVCPTGSTLMYAVNDGEYSTTLPTYNQTTALSVSTRCDCDGGEDPVFNLEGGTTNSPVSTVTTVPGVCPEAISYGSGNEITFGDPCKCDDPRNCKDSGVLYFHDTLTIPETGTMTTGLDIRINSASGFLIAVPCFGGALTVPVTGAAGTRIEEVGSTGVYKIEFWRPSGVQPTLSVLEGGLVTTAPAATFQPICTEAACTPVVPIEPIPTMSQLGLMIFGLLVMNLGVFFVQRTEFA